MARVPKKVEGVKGLLDNLNEALVILDPAFEVVEWNPAMERLTGVRSADAIGRSAAAMLPLFRDTTLVPLIRRGGLEAFALDVIAALGCEPEPRVGQDV